MFVWGRADYALESWSKRSMSWCRVQERIVEAGLYLDRIRLDDVPEGKLRNLFVAKDDLTFKPRGNPASLTETLQGTMTDDDAIDIAAY
jgi:hypothetical protein